MEVIEIEVVKDVILSLISFLAGGFSMHCWIAFQSSKQKVKIRGNYNQVAGESICEKFNAQN